jgi:hypothetical protein
MEGHRLGVFENRALRTISGSKRDEVIGSWRKLHNEYSPDIIRIIKLQRMRRAGHLACMGKNRMHVRF